ncbi:MAG TPA: hypothetical protein EYP10_06010 [Armatimonadetes bacterium]|nr:hypothetical protein [Armatimonadota bacterium]
MSQTAVVGIGEGDFDLRALIYRVVLNVVGLYIVAWLVGDGVRIGGLGGAFLVVLLFAILHALIRPILFAVRVVTFAVNWLTLGLWSLCLSLLVNALLFFGIGASGVIAGFEVHDFGSALIAVALLSIINAVGNVWLTRKRR